VAVVSIANLRAATSSLSETTVKQSKKRFFNGGAREWEWQSRRAEQRETKQ